MNVATLDQVVLLDDQGRPIGQADRVGLHDGDTPLHLAFSCYLFNDAGEVLLTRRALTKRTWPGVWTNSCCGHPRPGENPREAVQRRVGDELGLTVSALRLMLPDFRYRAVDAGGTVENEICPVWAGRVDEEPIADPAEVMETSWLDWEHLVTMVHAGPALLSPWCVRQVPLLDAELRRTEPRRVSVA